MKKTTANARQTGDEDIDVLLVDDNVDWARLTARALEKEEDLLDIEVVNSANEAMVALEDRGKEIDCVLSDYHMPEVNGLDLLEQVREKHPKMPFVLITGKGSENVAAEAIRAGVSDYFVKDPAVDRSPSFASRIVRAVETERLSRRVEESEELHRTVIQQSRDGVLITDEDGVRLSNEAFRDLSGYDEEELAEIYLLELFHPSDRALVESAYDDGFSEGGEAPDTFEACLVSKSGETRVCEIRSKLIDHRGEDAMLWTFRDVTERKRHEWEKERRKELNRTVQRVLVRSSTRGGIERGFCDGIAEHEPYVFAWIGDFEDGMLVPRARSGDDEEKDGYLAFLEDDGGGDDEPSAWAVRSREPRFVQDIGEIFETSWSEAALDRGFASVAALPLEHNDISYGVLSVYSDEAGVFTAAERETLEQVSDVLSYSIDAAEKESALLSDEYTEVEVRADAAAGYYDAVLDAIDPDATGVEIRVTGTVRTDDGALQFVDVDGAKPDSMIKVDEEVPEVEEVEEMEAAHTDESDGRYRLRVTDPPPWVRLAEVGVVVSSTSVSHEGVDLRLEVPPNRSVSEIVEESESIFGSVSVRMCRERDEESFERGVRINVDSLTEKQAQALRTAYHHGYFEQPKGSSAEKVAEALGVSRSTFVQHVRAAQRKVFGEMFGDEGR